MYLVVVVGGVEKVDKKSTQKKRRKNIADMGVKIFFYRYMAADQ
jgi:hypothetical protein